MLSDSQIENLLDGIEGGNTSAVDKLLAGHRGRLRQMVASRIDLRLIARVDPSDVVQDVLIEATRKLPEYCRSRNIPFYPWLRQMAWDRLVELHRQHVRVQKRSVQREVSPFGLSDQSVTALVSRLPGYSLSPSAEAIRNEMKSRVRDHLNQLDETTREVLVMRYVEQLKLREIAASLGVSESAVKSRHIRGLQSLATLMSDLEENQ